MSNGKQTEGAISCKNLSNSNAERNVNCEGLTCEVSGRSKEFIKIWVKGHLHNMFSKYL